MWKKRLDLEDKVNFKINNVTVWLAITIYILPNTSQSKGNQTIKCGQLIEYSVTTEIFLFKNYAENEARRLVPDPFLVFLKSLLYEVKACDLQLCFNIF